MWFAAFSFVVVVVVVLVVEGVEDEGDDEDEFDFVASHRLNCFHVPTRNTQCWRFEHLRQPTVPDVWTTRVSLASRAGVSRESHRFVPSLFVNTKIVMG